MRFNSAFKGLKCCGRSYKIYGLCKHHVSDRPILLFDHTSCWNLLLDVKSVLINIEILIEIKILFRNKSLEFDNELFIFGTIMND
jgi:hypothetical protein